jgi:hypothetical protein
VTVRLKLIRVDLLVFKITWGITRLDKVVWRLRRLVDLVRRVNLDRSEAALDPGMLCDSYKLCADDV